MRIIRTALVLSLSVSAVAAAQGMAPRGPAPPGAPPAAAVTTAPGQTPRPYQPTAAASLCSGHGQLVAGLCSCAPGWSGASCQAPAGSICSGHGTLAANGSCICSTFWMGPNCSIAGLSLTGPVFPP